MTKRVFVDVLKTDITCGESPFEFGDMISVALVDPRRYLVDLQPESRLAEQWGDCGIVSGKGRAQSVPCGGDGIFAMLASHFPEIFICCQQCFDTCNGR